MSNPVKESLNVAEALGMKHSLSTSRNFNKVIWAIDPFLGYPIEFLSQFGVKQDLLDYKEEWLEKREDSIINRYIAIHTPIKVWKGQSKNFVVYMFLNP